jgi:hypothetical protein
MSIPEQQPPLDPVSQVRGRLDGRFDELEKRVDERFAALDKRFATFARAVDTRFGEMRWWLVVLATWVTAVIAGVAWLTRGGAH